MIAYVRAGRIGYDKAWAWQRRLHAQRVAGAISDTALLLEHDPVYTAGKRTEPWERPAGSVPVGGAAGVSGATGVSGAAGVIGAAGVSGAAGVIGATPVIDVDRGGKITWHGPGQLTGYPIVKLPDPVDVVAYVRRLEEALAAVCAQFGVETTTVEGRSGVWTPDGGRKIAAIGIRVARGVTMHGFALNCDCDLAAYDAIVPCGITDATVTSLTKEAGQQITVADAIPVVERELDRALSAVPVPLKT